MKEIFLKQSRRDNTHGVQLTPHKQSAVWGLLILATLFLTACNGDKFSFTGDYSYKLSGEVKLTDTDCETTFRLIHRNGQMNILRD